MENTNTNTNTNTITPEYVGTVEESPNDNGDDTGEDDAGEGEA